MGGMREGGNNIRYNEEKVGWMSEWRHAGNKQINLTFALPPPSTCHHQADPTDEKDPFSLTPP